MRAILITMITCLPFVFLAQAQPESTEPDSEWGRTISRTLEHDGQNYAWSVMIPEHAEVGGAAILFLHGAGECGTDGKKNLEAGLPWHVRNETENWPFVIITPTDTFTALPGKELIVDPFALGEAFAEVADEFTINPQSHLAV